MTEIDVVIADITTFPADAIVNAANVSLKGGGGVDGAIHRAAGEALDIACSLFGGCPTGETRTTIAFNIKTAKFIIHTPGPRFSDARAEECDALLEACYRNSLRAAEEHVCKSVAFPSISTGIYRFPLDRAAAIVARVFDEYRTQPGALERVTMCCFDDASAQAYRAAFAQRKLI